MVVSRRKQQGKTTEQEGKRDLKTSKVTELAKGGEQTGTLSQHQQMINRLKGNKISKRIQEISDTDIIGLIGLRRKTSNDFEMTMENEMDCEVMLDGIMINGQKCEVRKLCATEEWSLFLICPVT